MKKSLYARSILTAALVAGVAWAIPSVTMAKVTGQCANCHTMHNSQNGAVMVSTGTEPMGTLLRNNCVGCHATDGTDKLVGASKIPAVIRPAMATVPLPGGYFDNNNTATTDFPRFHNVLDVVGVDTNITAAGDSAHFTPPGWDESVVTDISNGAANWNSQLRCAGTYGCHGDHSKDDQGAAISGGHHNGTAVGFRLLKGIGGAESTDYTIGKNVYSGESMTSGNVTTTMSYLCSECHGDFHGGTDVRSGNFDATGAWIRHPTDFQLSAAYNTNDAYSTYGGASAYNIEVPVGKTGLGGTATVSTSASDFADWPAAGAGYVMCISCHYAHGGDNPDLLRWSYAKMIAGNAGAAADTGCFRCHTAKDS